VSVSDDQITAKRNQPPAGELPAKDVPSLPPVWLMGLALVAVSANLRVAIASVPPLARTIADDLDLSNAWIGAVTTLPVL